MIFPMTNYDILSRNRKLSKLEKLYRPEKIESDVLVYALCDKTIMFLALWIYYGQKSKTKR